ncbi:hypothetical protein [Lacibacter sediminis]|uniref:Cytochrome c domain-containing protein n=1 Tax=Lacibacter sediminis TaxID=2760713 RepID=A0A7G5XFA4_9BACT|nr:hypothetical protein [Lacibacter sediminis]QNA44157.1 hypothetical protein H4075_19115 [Lacibacter sediminis]
MKWLVSCTMLIAVCFVSSCKKSGGTDNGGGGNGGGGTTYTPNCTSAAIQFSANVLPIIQASCTVSGCHNAPSATVPFALNTYAEINQVKTQIRAAVLSGSMPKSGTLTAAQKNSIICWIDAGAANN